jgi:hypothetical protein
MIQKIVPLSIFLAFMFCSCIPAKPLPTPTATSTPSWTATPFPSPSWTHISTSLPTLTPLPTFSSYAENNDAFNQLLETNGGCQLPCWWGITPGVTTWSVTQQFIQRFREDNYIDKLLGTNDNLPGFSGTVDSYVWSTYAPTGDVAAFVDFKVIKNVVTEILVPDLIVRNTFPMYVVLQEYGVPDRVYIGPNPSQKNDSHYLNTTAYAIYEKSHIMIILKFWGARDTAPKKLCEFDRNEELLLWAPDEEINFGYFNEPDIKPLEQVSSMTPQTFYNKYKNKMSFEKVCIDITNDIWK